MFQLNFLFFFIIFCGGLFPTAEARCEVISTDTTWSGEMELVEDALILPGVTLTIAAGTQILVQPADNTKIDPEYLSHQTEILVRGLLKVEGEPTKPVSFDTISASDTQRWAGIIIDQGRAEIHHARVANSESGVTVVGGALSINDSELFGNRYGIVGQGSTSKLTIKDCLFNRNDYGLLELDRPITDKQNLRFSENSKNDSLSLESSTLVVKPRIYLAEEGTNITHTYKDEALVGTTVWKGKVLIDGQLRVPPEARLIILPGTIVEFTKKDTNNDTIGENGLMIQGQLIAKGTPEKPILFRSAESDKKLGDWDAINILGSDLSQNLLEFCQVENAYRGVHFHFSNVAVNSCVFRNNYRGAQFQESLVSVVSSQFYANKSGIQARDSEAIFNNNEIFYNLNGANFFRFNLTARHNTFGANRWDGLRIREGTTEIADNRLVGNRTGMLIADAVYGNFSRNVMAGNLEVGLMVRDTDNIEVRGNAVMKNGINGISLKTSRAMIADNLIAENGERGIGVESFTGMVRNNNIMANGLYGIGLDGSGDVDATGNFWGTSDLAKELYDKNDEPQLGTINYEPRLEKSIAFVWPLTEIRTNISWLGEIGVTESIKVPPGAGLSIRPSTTVVFHPGKGLFVTGNISAQGEADKRITFTSITKEGPSEWGEISIEHANDSGFTNCDFEYATWGLHCHFVPMTVSRCRFRINDGGIRFRSGPLMIENSLFTGNRIGVRAFRGNSTLTGNEFRANEIGVFVREGGSGIILHNNNFINNDRYALRLGDFDKEDVDAASNWWDGKPTADLIFDGRVESYIGMVNFEPVLDKPVTLEEF